jgi:hypothetical protein
MRYRIYSKKSIKEYSKVFKNEEEARHWVINHLDLSLDWKIEEIKR